MKKLLQFALVTLVAPLAMMAQSVWKPDMAHSRIGFSIDHLAISEVTGHFGEFDLSVTAAKEDFSDAVFKLSIPVKSIDTAVEKRNEHLRSPDFFDAAQHPAMTFTSKSISGGTGGKYTLKGDLTLHGVTKPVEMQLWYRGTITNQGKTVAGLQLTGTIKRSDFNLGSKFPTAMIGDEVRIKADGEFTKQ
jgi:polyisoprenoid-binding protein YceI